MRVKLNWLFIASCIILVSTLSDARKIRVRPSRPVEADEETAADTRGTRIQYYAAEDPQEEQPNVVLVSADDYNGYYGQQSQSTPTRVVQESYIPQSRASNSRPKQQETLIRQKETPKAPPVQTIRNYNKVNDDGSFTFGYEAADGSFKEETRGTDCVVRGKYGYVDPDGNKREFTYVSGNPCDPNAAPEDSDERPEGGKSQEQEEDDGVANYPKAFPVRPVTARPTQTARPTPPPARAPVTTVFQNVYNQGAEEEEEDEAEPLQVLRPQTPRPRIIQPQPRPHFVQQPYQLQRLEPTTQNSILYQSSNSPVTITPRPTTIKAQLPATTYRPQLVAVTPRPQLYTTEDHPHRLFPSSTPSPITRTPQGGIDFAAEFQKFAQENVIQSTPKTLAKTTEKGAKPFQGSEPIYSSELVYDPSSGQYKTQLYQTLPQTTGDFTLNHRIQPYVAPQQQQRLVSLQQLQQQSPLYRAVQQQPQPRPSNQQLYQQQQSEIQFQNSQQLFAQQQRARAQAQQAGPRPAPVQAQQGPQQFYYVQQPHEGSPLSSGQIDAFLRGHNINFQ